MCTSQYNINADSQASYCWLFIELDFKRKLRFPNQGPTNVLMKSESNLEYLKLDLTERNCNIFDFSVNNVNRYSRTSTHIRN
jgi:hypothetical protein